jgi:adenylate cyclase
VKYVVGDRDCLRGGAVMSVSSDRTVRIKPDKPAGSNLHVAAAAYAENEKKTKKQLIDELVDLRERLSIRDVPQSGGMGVGTELKGARERLQYLLAASPAIIYTTQASGDFACTFVSENLRAIMGYSPDEMTTDPKCWPDHLHPEDVARVFEEMRPLIERGGGTVEYRFRHRDGHYIWIQDTFRVVNDDAGHPLELVGAWADISERRSIETELGGARQRLLYLLSISPAIIYTTQASGDYACTFISTNLRAIMGYSPEEMTTDPKCWPDHLHPEDAPRIFEDMHPLIERGGGTVEYRFRHRDGHYIWIQDTFKVVNDDAGHPLELVGAWADITERKTIETELNGTRQRLQYLLAVSPAIIYTTQASGDLTCTYVSENLRAIMGYTPQEMTTNPRCWADHVHPEDAPRVFDEMPPLIERGGGTLEYRFRHRDGHYIWIQDTFKVINDGAGHPLELVGAWADITERKQAEQEALKANAELQETKRYLTRLIESSTDAIIATDKEGKVVLFNEGAEILLGYRAEEVIGRRTTELYSSEEQSAEVVREMRKRGGTVAGFESALRTKDGKGIPVLISASVLFGDHGQEVGTVGFATDLRTRKREEEELRKAHDELEKRVEERTTELKAARERLRYLMTVTPAIVYTNQANDYTCTFVSENVSRIMGFSAWEMLEDRDFWTVRLHPEDAPRVFEEMRPLIERGGGTLEYRFRHRDGHYIWIQDTFRVIHDTQGHPSEIVGSWADISDRKQAEEALGKRMAVMNDLETLVGASPAIIYTTQVSGDYACTFVSENLNSIMAYAPWEMRDDKKFWVKRLHPEDADRVFAELDQLVGQGRGALEYRFRHRDGHYIWIQDTFTVTHDKDGKPKEIVGSWADVSDRKRIEAELQRLAEQVELRNRFIRETFGRYLTDEVVDAVLESPTGLQMGGEKRKVTMIMTDLRGFTSLSERLAPERVVAMLNRYLTTMVSVIKQYHGTVDDFIGDAIFVLFGAPIWREDDAQRAVACAVAMQLAMASVNEQNRQEDLPEIEMGIGVHTGQVVVGNIGSPERMKYDVIGSQVNLTSRIQSYTTGGQILISETTRQEVGRILKLGKQMEVKAKGIEQPVTLFEVLGIGGSHKLLLPNTAEDLVPLAARIPLRYEIVDASHLNGEVYNGTLTKLSRKEAEAHLDHPVPNLTNIKMHLLGKDSQEIPGSLYGKVVGLRLGSSTDFSIRFTSVPPEIETFLRGLLGSRPVEANDAATSIAADNALSASTQQNAAANH